MSLQSRVSKLENERGRKKLRGILGNPPGRRPPPDDWSVIPLGDLHCFRAMADYLSWCAKNALNPDQGLLIEVKYG
jgi:hypothetical protein